MSTEQTCEDCAAAQAGPHHGFTSRCKGCEARAVSRCITYFRAKHAERGTQDGKEARDAYREMLAGVMVTHAQVQEAAARDFVTNGGGR